MKKAMAVLFVSIALAPTASAGQSTFPDQAQAPSESQTIVIVNPTPEQVLSADRQILSSDAEGIEEGQPLLDDTGGEGPTFDVPVVFNEKVESHIHYFTDRIRVKFSEWLARSERYLPMMKKTFREKGLPEDLTYLALIESGFSTKAVSRARAVGQWQFIKGTGKRYGLRIDRWIDERRDPEKATEAAAEYLSDLYAMFNDWYLAAAGYNAGEGKIIRAINRYDTNDFWELSQPKYRYLRRETKNYVPKLIAAAMIAKEPAKYGFDNIEYHPPLAYEKVTLNGMKDLREIASISECSLEDLKSLNPELKTNFTPPNYPNYQLKVPVGKKEVVESRVSSIKTVQERVALKEVGPEKKARKYNSKKRVSQKRIVSYVVRKGDTLHEIAARYNVPMDHLISWNNLWGKTLQAGNRLKIYVDRGAGSDKKLY
jgi:membrane-bound lytic murein transglycosylase D